MAREVVAQMLSSFSDKRPQSRTSSLRKGSFHNGPQLTEHASHGSSVKSNMLTITVPIAVSLMGRLKLLRAIFVLFHGCNARDGIPST